jgi:hypothetical protein
VGWDFGRVLARPCIRGTTSTDTYLSDVHDLHTGFGAEKNIAACVMLELDLALQRKTGWIFLGGLGFWTGFGEALYTWHDIYRGPLFIISFAS